MMFYTFLHPLICFCRLVPGQDIYYKMKPPQNILLQSDMSKHVDAKPFNPGGHQPNQPMTNPRKAG